MKFVFVFAVSSMASLWSPAITAMAARQIPKGGLLQVTSGDTSQKLSAILTRDKTHMALLADAEQQHDKAVNALRGRVSTLLEKEAKVFGTMVRNYGLDLERATDRLARSLNATREELSRVSNASVPDKAQQMLEQRGQDSVKAVADVAERVLIQVEEHSAHLVRQALSRAEQPLVSAVDELSVPLGEMSSESEGMNTTLRDFSSTGSLMSEGGAPNRVEAVVNLTTNERLATEVEHIRSLVDAASVRLNLMLANETQKLQSEVKGIKKASEAAKQQELKLLRGSRSQA